MIERPIMIIIITITIIIIITITIIIITYINNTIMKKIKIKENTKRLQFIS